MLKDNIIKEKCQTIYAYSYPLYGKIIESPKRSRTDEILSPADDDIKK
jgi:hypothetical protein